MAGIVSAVMRTEQRIRAGSLTGTQTDYYDSTDFKVQRRPMRFDALIKRRALRITYSSDGKGGIDRKGGADKFSVATYMNEIAPGSDQIRRHPDRPESYPIAERMLNQSAPNLGAERLIDDGKYRQIVDSARMLGMSDKEIFQ